MIPIILANKKRINKPILNPINPNLKKRNIFSEEKLERHSSVVHVDAEYLDDKRKCLVIKKLAPMVQLGSLSGLSVDLDQCRFQN